jgi:hypothetical protein
MPEPLRQRLRLQGVRLHFGQVVVHADHRYVARIKGWQSVCRGHKKTATSLRRAVFAEYKSLN